VLKKSGHYHGYLTDLDPSISNAFAGAAYRFGHSQIQNEFHRYDNKYKPITPSIPMNRTFDPTFLYQTEKEGVDSILRGLAKDKSQKTDG
jgi:peroxidase